MRTENKDYKYYRKVLTKTIAKTLGYSIKGGGTAYKIISINGLYLFKRFLIWKIYNFRMSFGVDILPEPSVVYDLDAGVYLHNDTMKGDDIKKEYANRVKHDKDVLFGDKDCLDVEGIVSDCAKIDSMLKSIDGIRDYMEIMYQNHKPSIHPFMSDRYMAYFYMMIRDKENAIKCFEKMIEKIDPTPGPDEWNKPDFPKWQVPFMEFRYENIQLAERNIALLNKGEWQTLMEDMKETQRQKVEHRLPGIKFDASTIVEMQLPISK